MKLASCNFGFGDYDGEDMKLTLVESSDYENEPHQSKRLIFLAKEKELFFRHYSCFHSGKTKGTQNRKERVLEICSQQSFT